MTRLRQFELLAERIQKLIDKQTPEDHELILITGDLNTDAKRTYTDLDFSAYEAFFVGFILRVNLEEVWVGGQGVQ